MFEWWVQMSFFLLTPQQQISETSFGDQCKSIWLSTMDPKSDE